jgi:hypothetical protein
MASSSSRSDVEIPEYRDLLALARVGAAGEVPTLCRGGMGAKGRRWKVGFDLLAAREFAEAAPLESERLLSPVIKEHDGILLKLGEDGAEAWEIRATGAGGLRRSIWRVVIALMGESPHADYYNIITTIEAARPARAGFVPFPRGSAPTAAKHARRAGAGSEGPCRA